MDTPTKLVFLISVFLQGCSDDGADLFQAASPPSPAFNFASTPQGCGGFFVYRHNADRTNYLTIWVSTQNFTFTTTETTLQLAEYTDDIAIAIDTYESPPFGEPYCTDVIDPGLKVDVISASSGTIKVSLDTDNPPPSCSELYAANITLENILFSIDGKDYLLNDELFNVEVGSCSG